jgi:HD-GYP domain-containing protein (c-di-GMP phosphodiesterase class II)
VLIVSIDELKPGAKLAVGVMHPRQHEQELLKAGYILDQKMIDRLRSLEVSQVFVDFPGLEDLDKILLPVLSPERRAIYDQIKSAVTANEKATKPVVKYNAYHDATRAFIQTMLCQPQNAMLLDVLGSGGEEIEHATTVAHLTIVLGLKIEAYLIRERPRLAAKDAKDVTSLGIAAMLHDIGKTKLPAPLHKCHAFNLPKSDADRDIWQTHTALGFEMVRGDVDAATAATVLHHHQRFDGSGFPKVQRGDRSAPLAGRSIHVMARILGAADLFERLATRPDGTRRTNYETLRLINVHFAAHLDPEVLAAMPQVIPPFSPGRRVTLSDGTTAIITGFHPHSPYHPVVKRFDAQTMRTETDSFDLRTNDTVTITHIDGQCLADLDQSRLAA